MKVLIISDSRGRRLQALLEGLNPNFAVRVLVHPGAGLELVVLKSISTLRDLKPDLVLVFAGVCDLTWKNKQNKKVGLRHSNIQDNVDQVMGAVKSSHDLLKTVGTFKISYTTITGVDLTDYNQKSRIGMSDSEYDLYRASITQHRDQGILNDSIIAINKRIVKFNKNCGTRTTWTAGVVHAYANKSYHHHYRRLRDGCHPNDGTAHAWARQIVKSVERLMPNSTVNLK